MMETAQHRASGDSGLFQPDVILPSQLLSEFRCLMPEKRLMAAIVDDAVNCFLKYRFATHPRGRRLFREAEEWIMDGDRGWAFSFQSICDTLGLDAGCLRKGLRQWHTRHAGQACASLGSSDPAEAGVAAPLLQVVA